MRHLQASKSTRSSRSKASALLLLALAGCAPPGEVSVTPEQDQEVPKLNEITFLRLNASEDVPLVFGDRSLYLGTTKAEALEEFEPLEKSVEFASLPPQFGDDFKAFGWETDSFGFGGITYADVDPVTSLQADVLVFVMVTQEDVDEDTVQAIVQAYTALQGEPTTALPGSRIAYWFWSRPGRRVMVNTAVDSKGEKSLTVAVGETQVMTLLGMSAEQAKADKDRAIQRLNAQGEPQ